MKIRLLTKFWMNTPIGKLEFTRVGALTWQMYLITKGGAGTRSVDMPYQKVKPQEVIERFGWPQNSFSTYGDRYEDVPEVKKIEPAYITVPPDIFAPMVAMVVPGKILWFHSMGDLKTYQEQQGEK